MNLEKNDSKTWKNQFAIDLLLATTVLLIPFVIYIHLFFDKEKKILTFFGYEYNHLFHDNETFAWHVISNIINLTIVTLIYFSSKGKWRVFLQFIIIYFFTTFLFAFSESTSYLKFLISPSIVLINVLNLILLVSLDKKIKKRSFYRCVTIPPSIVMGELFFSWNSKYAENLSSLIKSKSNLGARDYLYRIYYLSEIVNSRYNEKSENIAPGSATDNNKKTKKILSVITFLTVLILYLYVLIPPDKEIIEFGGFVIERYGFEDVKTFYWHVSKKLALCILAIIWFVSNLRWWRWAIISPIIFYSYQFWESFQPVNEIDGAGNLSVFPLVFITILGVLLLSRIVRRISVNLDYKAILEEELDKSIGELSKLEGKV